MPETMNMQGGKYNFTPGTPRTRLERLIRERELRRLNRYGSLEDLCNGGNREEDLSPLSTDGQNTSYFNEYGLGDGIRIDGGKEVRPKQRLLVVANRLPVSAVRKGEESWHLEVSVGGLVSALLGINMIDIKHYTICFFVSWHACVQTLCFIFLF